MAAPWRTRTEISPERTKVWTEPKPRTTDRKVPVVYYISRNGHLEHPHFMEVPISTDGLYLRDVINRLNLLRGKGMATMYSWSSKRSYKNGFVWHDLTEDDFIYPAHGHEYVLKGSELLLPGSSSPRSQDSAASSSSTEKPLDLPKPIQDDADLPLPRKKIPTPWKSMDLNEYKVYKNELTAESSVAADAATQTDERRHRRRALLVRDEDRAENPAVEPARDEISISPPPSSSSPETLETLIRADGRVINGISGEVENPDRPITSGRMKASAVLINLISCGSISVKDHLDLSLVDETPSFPAARPEERDYFSGSLVETKKKVINDGNEFPGLKRSSSYNADRSMKLELAEEMEGVRAKCIPRKPKMAARKEGSTHGTSRINDEPTQQGPQK